MNSTPGGVPLTSSTSATGSAAAAGPVLGPDRKAARTIRLRDHFTAAPLNNRPMTDGTERHALAAAVTDQPKRCPEDRIGIREHGLCWASTRPLPSIRPVIACCIATARLRAGFVPWPMNIQ